MTRYILSLVVLLTASAAVAQPAGFEKVLFPIVIPTFAPVPGALGSQWVTDLAVLNRADVEVPLSGEYVCFQCRTPHGLKPGVTYGILPLPPGSRVGEVGGSFLFVDSRYIDQVRFGLRVRDISRQADGFGSEVPVVRQRDFRADGVSLLSIPNLPNARITLRVYGFDPALAGTVAVRVYDQPPGLAVNLFSDMPPDSLIADRTYPVTYLPNFPADLDNFPRYAQIGDLPLPAKDLARIDVVPLTPGMRIWAFATVTNNDTQEVTVISPH
jgi:hypothetical protein